MDMLPSESLGLTVETVEWLPSGGATGLLRVRGHWTGPHSARRGLPVLVVGAGEETARHLSLPEPGPSAEDGAWRGAYILGVEVIEAQWSLALEGEGGAQLVLPAPAVGPASSPQLVPDAPDDGDRGGEVIEREVLAERRARRAESAEQAQAKIAAEALKALEVLELRGSELERRIEELTSELRQFHGDAGDVDLREHLSQARAQAARSESELAAAQAAVRSVEARAEERLREAAAAAEEQAERQRVALVGALDTAAALRDVARGWIARHRSSELARTSDSVRLAVLEARRGSLETELRAAREALADRAQELAVLRDQADLAAIAIEEAYGAATQAREALAAAQARSGAFESEVQETRTRLEEAARELSQAQKSAQAKAAELDAERAASARALTLLHESRTTASGALAELRVERVARQTLAADLAAARGRIAALEAARDKAAEPSSPPDPPPTGDRMGRAEGSTLDPGALARSASSLGGSRPSPDSTRMRLDLDAAAAALRARTPAPETEVQSSPPGAEAEAQPPAAPAPAPAPGTPARSLREVLADLASADPAIAARRHIAALLPARLKAWTSRARGVSRGA